MEDDFEDHPDMLCADCGDGCWAEDRHGVESWERFNAILCRGCFDDRCDEETED